MEPRLSVIQAAADVRYTLQQIRDEIVGEYPADEDKTAAEICFAPEFLTPDEMLRIVMQRAAQIESSDSL